MDAHALRVEAIADRFDGLPQGVTRWRLAAALRAAARPLGLTSPMLRLLEHYIDLSYDQDWTMGSEPVIGRPLTEIAAALGRGERQIRNIERALMEKGLLVFRDSGNHQRRARRDRKTGLQSHAYGPSLAPLGARAMEIIDAATRARAELQAASRLRLAISARRRRLRALLEEARERGIESGDLAERFAETPARSPARLSLNALHARRDTLDMLTGELETRLHATTNQADEPPAIASQGEIFDRPSPDTSLKQAASSLRSDKRSTNEKPIRLETIMRAAGPLLRNSMAMNNHDPGWRELIDAAHDSLPAIGVDQNLWGEACQNMGRERAALAVLILERGLDRTDGAPIRWPNAYLRGMMRRNADGALHLDRSIRGLAARQYGEINRRNSSASTRLASCVK